MLRKHQTFMQLRYLSGGIGILLSPTTPYKRLTNTHEMVVQGNIQITKDVKAVLKEYIQDSKAMESVSQYYFDGEGKAFRPRLIMATANAINHHLHVANRPTIQQRQYDIALISEMYHTASLYHDDVIDKADLRRGKESANKRWGEKASVFGGNFVLATSYAKLAKLRDPKVVSLMSTTLQDLVVGELQQLGCNGCSDTNDRFNSYLRKTYNKTASLMAHSCQAVTEIAIDAGSPENIKANKNEVALAAFSFGKNLGIAFQLIDDYLDFSASTTGLGKPAAADLKLGLATAPVLFAANQHEELEALILRRFSREGDANRAFKIVIDSDALEQTKTLANSYGSDALESIKNWKESEAKQDLLKIIHDVIDRVY